MSQTVPQNGPIPASCSCSLADVAVHVGAGTDDIIHWIESGDVMIPTLVGEARKHKFTQDEIQALAHHNRLVHLPPWAKLYEGLNESQIEQIEETLFESEPFEFRG